MINNSVKLLFLLLLVSGLSFMAWGIRDFGEPDGEISMYDETSGESYKVKRTAMDDHFIENSQSKETSTNNAVTAIVFDYRGFDTLGEATVLFAAVTGVLVSIRHAFKSRSKPKGGG